MYRWFTCLIGCVCLLATTVGWSQEYPTATVVPHLGVLEHTATGVMYVDENLLKEYTQLKQQVDDVRGQVFRSGGSAKAMLEKLAALEQEFETLRAKIDGQKVHAQPFGVFSRRDTQSFDIGDAQQIVITSDDVIVRGWNGKNIKCVVEKFVLGEEEPGNSEFEAIVVKHEVRLADDLLGMSDQARETYEKKYLKSEAGKKLTQQGLQSRARFNAEIRAGYLMYQPLQGHAVNVLQITGLTGREGNQHLTGRTESPKGGATLGGYWKRSAKVTIYVPKCKHVTVRGCKKAVDIKSIEANLILTTHDSQDISYGSDFAIRDIDGDVLIDQVPIRVIAGVRGNVEIRQTDEFTNTGTMHRGKFRTSTSPAPDPTTIREVSGNLRGEFVRADLYLKEVSGTIDVINEYGNTELTIEKPLSAAVHRVVSHSGVIRAITPRADSAGIPIFAFTQTGTAQVAFPRAAFDDRSFGGGGRSWYGFQTAGIKIGFSAMQRPQSAWDNEKRSHGLDLISNSGSVIVGPQPREP